jgi:hypothetical protein
VCARQVGGVRVLVGRSFVFSFVLLRVVQALL